MRQIHFRRAVTVLLLGYIFRASAAMAQASVTTRTQIQDTGISGVWLLANVSFAGMRAQGWASRCSGEHCLRICSFAPHDRDVLRGS